MMEALASSNSVGEFEKLFYGKLLRPTCEKARASARFEALQSFSRNKRLQIISDGLSPHSEETANEFAEGSFIKICWSRNFCAAEKIAGEIYSYQSRIDFRHGPECSGPNSKKLSHFTKEICEYGRDAIRLGAWFRRQPVCYFPLHEEDRILHGFTFIDQFEKDRRGDVIGNITNHAKFSACLSSQR